MDSIKFLKLDYKMAKSYMFGILIFIGCSILFSIGNIGILFSIGYLCFGITMFINIPFNSELGYGSFYDTLPGKDETKVTGRFLYMMSHIVLVIVMSLIVCAIKLLKGDIVEGYNLLPISIVISFTIIMASIQYTLNYKFGRIKSQLINTLIRILPAVLLFGGSSILGEIFNSDPDKIVQLLINNYILVSAVFILLAVFIFLVNLSLSIRIYKNTDC